MLEDMAVEHPLAGPIVRQPRNANTSTSRHDQRLFPPKVRRWLAIAFEYLEEESVQVKRVIHARRVDDVPHLQLSDRDRLGAVVRLAVDEKHDFAVGFDAFSESHLARRAD